MGDHPFRMIYDYIYIIIIFPYPFWLKPSRIRPPPQLLLMEPDAEPTGNASRRWQRLLFHYLRVRSWQRLWAALGQRLQVEDRAVRDRVQRVYPKE